MALSNQLLKFLDNKYNQLFLGVLFIGIFLRLKYFLIESIWNDASVHLWFAIKLLQEPSFIFTVDFLTGDYVIPQFITAFFYIFTQNIFIAGKLMVFIYTLIGIVFIYLLGSELRSKAVGILAAILFVFNPLIWFYGVRPLAEAPLIAMFIVVAYCFVKLTKEKTLFWSYTTIFMIFAAILTKMYAILLLISFVIYVLVFMRKEFMESRAIRRSVLYLVGILFIANIVFYALFRKIIVAPFFLRIFSLEGLQQGFEAISYIPYIISSYVLVLFVVGIFFVMYYKIKLFNFMLLTMIIYWFYFEFAVRSVLDRYMLPIIPYIILFAVFGLIEVANVLKLLVKVKYMKLIFISIIMLIVCISNYSYGTALIDSKVNTYTGYQEAGGWIKANVEDTNVVIFAGSWRSIRAFSEREVYNSYSIYQDGEIVNLRSEHYLERSQFEQDLQQAILDGKQIYLEIDIWEYAQHNWYFPLTQESVSYFQQIGFVPVKIIERDVQTQQGKQTTPVILIFKYNQ